MRGGLRDCVAAIDEVAEVLATARARERAKRAVKHQRLCGAIEAAAGDARGVREREIERQRRDARELRLGPSVEPADPAALSSDPLSLLAYADQEIRWTRLLEGLLARRGGDLPRACLVIALSNLLAAKRVEYRGDLALDREAIQEVRAEVRDAEAGQPDLVLWTDRSVVVIENKLFAPWSDGHATTQADAYRDYAEREVRTRGAARHVLVLLAAGGSIEAPPEWCKVTYAELARELRHGLRRALHAASPLQDVLPLMPVFELVRAIEGLFRDRQRGSGPSSPWAEYLELRALLGTRTEAS